MPRLQFRLRTLLILLSAVAVWLGYLTAEARRQRDAVQALRAIGGIVWYDFELNPTLWKAKVAKHKWVASFASHLGPDWWADVEEVRLLANISVSKQTLEGLSKFPRLEELSLSSAAITDDDVPLLIKLSSLRRLDLSGTRVSWGAVWQLERALPICNLTPATSSHLYDILSVVLDDAVIERATGLSAGERHGWPELRRVPCYIDSVDSSGEMAVAGDVTIEAVDRGWYVQVRGNILVKEIGCDKRGWRDVHIAKLDNASLSIVAF